MPEIPEGDEPVTDYVPQWQAQPAPFNQDDPQSVPPDHPAYDYSVWLDAVSPSPSMDVPPMGTASQSPPPTTPSMSVLSGVIISFNGTASYCDISGVVTGPV